MDNMASCMSEGLEVEKQKAEALGKLASAAFLAHAPIELRTKIGQQEAELVLLTNEVKLASLKRKLSEK